MAARSSRLPRNAAPADDTEATRAPQPDARVPGSDALALLGLPAGRTLVMGVVNATPDSFHHASRAASADAAVARALHLVAEGADLLDVGGESTRPDATPVSLDDELARVVPVVRGLALAGCRVPISVDTYKAAVARSAVAAGARIVNDVSGGLLDDGMPRVVADVGATVVVGHLRGTPRTMTAHADYEDVAADVRRELAARIDAFVTAGVPREHILADPGIGFAKGASANLELLRRLGELATLGVPLVIGVSRKRFVGEAMRAAGLPGADDPGERLEGSLAAAVLAAARGARVVRTHDVAATRRALAIADAILHEA